MLDANGGGDLCNDDIVSCSVSDDIRYLRNLTRVIRAVFILKNYGSEEGEDKDAPADDGDLYSA